MSRFTVYMIITASASVSFAVWQNSIAAGMFIWCVVGVFIFKE